MLLTEEEAKEKMCPHLSSNAFFEISDQYTRSREYRLVGRKCQASKCMAWEWDSYTIPERGHRRHAYGPAIVENPGDRPPSVPDSWEFHPSDADRRDACWMEPEDIYLTRLAQYESEYPRRGFCGLAGRVKG